MVDTINPQTGRSDSFDQNSVPKNENIPSNNYFAGFNKPEEVRVNLAAEAGTGAQPVQAVPAPPPPPPQPAPAPSMPTEPVQTPRPDFTPASPTVRHDAYSAGSSFNLKAVLVVLAGGFVLVGVFAATSYFVSRSIYNGKIGEENNELTDLRASLENEKKVPAALELPEIIEPPASEETPPVSTPEPNEESPIETPQPSNPATNEEGTG